MFTKKQRRFPIPWGSWVFFHELWQKPEKAAADGSVRQTVSGTQPWWLLPPNVRQAPLRPPGGQAAWGPGSVWPGKSFHRWTVRPLSCHSGTCWETQWAWSGSSEGCLGWAESCWGWPQTPDGTKQERYNLWLTWPHVATITLIYLKNVKCLKLDVAALVPEQVHH